MNKDPRYQFQSRIVKVYRWLQYKPKWAIISCAYIGWWILTGIPSHFVWLANFGPADFEMQHWYTQEEVNGNL